MSRCVEPNQLDLFLNELHLCIYLFHAVVVLSVNVLYIRGREKEMFHTEVSALWNSQFSLVEE